MSRAMERYYIIPRKASPVDTLLTELTVCPYVGYYIVRLWPIRRNSLRACEIWPQNLGYDRERYRFRLISPDWFSVFKITPQSWFHVSTNVSAVSCSIYRKPWTVLVCVCVCMFLCVYVVVRQGFCVHSIKVEYCIFWKVWSEFCVMLPFC